MTINYYLERRTERKNPELLILLFIRVKGKLLKIGTGEHILDKHWDKKTQRPKKGAPVNEYLTELLDSWEREIEDLRLTAKLQRKEITIDYLKSNLSFISDQGNDFFSIWDKWTAQHGKIAKWTPSTRTRYEQCRKILLEIDKSEKLEFNSLNEDFLERFIECHRDNGRSDPYTKKNLVILKGFLNWSIDHDHNTNAAFRKWKPVFEKVDVEENIFYLTVDERDRLLNLDIEDETARSVRDAFCFSCFTGLRYSDLKNLKKANVKNGKIEITTVKTKKKLSIKLPKQAREILAKYKDMPGLDALPIITNRGFNNILQDLAKLAGLNDTITKVSSPGGIRQEKTYPKWKKISCHWGRKTFVTTAIFLDIPLETVVEISGHTMEVAKRYYEIQDTKKDEAMDKFD